MRVCMSRYLCTRIETRRCLAEESHIPHWVVELEYTPSRKHHTRIQIIIKYSHFNKLGCSVREVGFNRSASDTAPSLSRSHIVKGYWIGGDRMRRECVGGSHVFIKGHASTECTDPREQGRRA
jgi:hypothetical protein